MGPKRMEAYSTSVLRDRWNASRAELRKHGCEVEDEEKGTRVRVKWPKGTLFDSETSEYTLPDGWTVKVGR